MDDQRDMRATTALLLRANGYTVFQAGSGEEALGVLASSGVDLMLADLKMEPMDGLTLLERAREVAPRLPVIMLTAFGSIESVVEAMRLGAHDYVTKPFQEGELCYRVERALERSPLLSRVEQFADELSERHGLPSLVGHSAAMRELTPLLVRVAQSDAPVLVQGESGTGKEPVRCTRTADARTSTSCAPTASPPKPRWSPSCSAMPREPSPERCAPAGSGAGGGRGTAARGLPPPAQAFPPGFGSCPWRLPAQAPDP